MTSDGIICFVQTDRDRKKSETSLSLQTKPTIDFHLRSPSVKSKQLLCFEVIQAC